MTRGRAAAVAAVAVLAGSAAPAAAQIGVSVRGVAGQVQSTALVSGAKEAVAGLWMGVAADVALGPVALGVRTIGGSMDATGNTNAISRDDSGEIEGRARVMPLSWIGIETSFTLRAFASAVGYQKWTMTGGGLVFAPTLGNPALRAHAKGIFLGNVSVDGRESGYGLVTQTGVRFAPAALPVTFAIAYRFESYSFPGTSAVRVEQFDLLTFELGVRFGAAAR